MKNDAPQSHWYWFGNKFWRWYNAGDGFWKGKHWKPYFVTAHGVSNLDPEFELTLDSSEHGPIYQNLNERYSKICGWNVYWQCSEFRARTSYLTSLIGKTNNQKICLVKDAQVGNYQNVWKQVTLPCPPVSKK